MDSNFSTNNFSNGSHGTDFDTGVTNFVPKWSEIVLVIYMLMTAILAISGNCIILLVEINNHFKTSTDWLVCFMAANDILIASFCIPMYIINHMGYWAEIVSGVICKLHFYIEYVTTFASAMLLGTVAIDRYFKTCRPHTKFLTPTRAFYVCIGIQTAACTLNGSTFGIVVYDNVSDCTYQPLAGGIVIGLLMSLFIISYIFMFVTVCVCYIKVAYTIKFKLIHNLAAMSPSAHTSATVDRKTDDNGSKSIKTSTTFFKRNQVVPVTNRNNDHESSETKMSNREEGGLFDQSVRISGTQVHSNETLNGASSSTSSNQKKACGQTVVDNSRSQSQKRRTDTRVDRTTKIMFAVTLVFILSWVPPWTSYFYKQLAKNQETIAGNVFAMFARKTYMINTFMNPIFYILMSSVFKKRTKQILEKMLSKCGIKR